MHDFMSKFSAKDEQQLWQCPGRDGHNSTAQNDEEFFHLQADGFWGSEKGFHDAEQLRNQ